MTGRTIAISDIHGCYDQLVALLRKVKLTKQDRLVILGDLVDRGPRSKDVVQLCINIKKQFPNTVVLKGNHDEMFIDYILKTGIYDYRVFGYNGGHATLDSYTNPETLELDIPQEHIDFLAELPLSFETSHYFFCHAGVNPNRGLKDQAKNDLLWIRDEFLNSRKEFGKIVVHGHTPSPIPDWQDNRIGIDTGGVFGDEFTAVDLDTLNPTFYTVPGYVKPKTIYGWS